MDHKSLKRSRQELNTPRRPLISTSKSPLGSETGVGLSERQKKNKKQNCPKTLDKQPSGCEEALVEE